VVVESKYGGCLRLSFSLDLVKPNNISDPGFVCNI
jgi:hypothetical protein